MTLSSTENKRIQEAIEEFHAYITELGIEAAKKITLESTVYKAVKNYVNNF
jgi:ribosomal 50S subunit-associated protein YjgA (DUF615 family)